MNVRNPGSNPGDPSPIFLPRIKNGKKKNSSTPSAGTSTPAAEPILSASTQPAATIITDTPQYNENVQI